MDPILQEATVHVSALPALTQPMATTIVDEFRYFSSVQPNCATVRTDGKRITFHNGYHKTQIQEDIDFLRKCIKQDPYGPFKEVMGADVEKAEAILDPRAALEKKLRADIMAELAAAGMLIPQAPNLQAADLSQKLSAVELSHAGEELLKGVDAASAAKIKLAALKTGNGTGGVISPLTGYAVPLLTPVSTSDIAGAAAGSSSGAGAPTAG